MDFALRRLVGSKTQQDWLKLRGMGWDGDIDEIKRDRWASCSPRSPRSAVVVVVDSSAWIENLRATEHPTDLAILKLLRAREEIATTEEVVMELLSGAHTDAEHDTLRAHVSALTLLPLRGLADFEAAAGLYRTCRAAGETIRSATDLLTAVVAIRAEVPVLHRDRDFDAIARHSPLRIHPVR